MTYRVIIEPAAEAELEVRLFCELRYPTKRFG
jgi:hypothetical protein